MKKKHLRVSPVIFLMFLLHACSQTPLEGPYFATGIKIGEVTQTEAIIWVRLTENPERVSNEALMPDVKYKDDETGNLIERSGRPDLPPVVSFPEGYNINNIQGATAGSEGMVRLNYKMTDDSKWEQLDWQTVDPERAFTHQFLISELSADRKYELLIEASPDGKKVSAALEGKFRNCSSTA